MLFSRLGPWLNTLHLQQKWKFITYTTKMLQYVNNKNIIYEPIPSQTRNRCRFQRTHLTIHTVSEINLPITPHEVRPITLYTVPMYIHAAIPISIQGGDNVFTFTICLEFPTDHKVHLYIAPSSFEKTTVGIIISNNKISHIIAVVVRTSSNATTNTDNIACLLHTVHCLKTNNFQTETQIALILHSNKQLTYAVKNHKPHPDSPSQCLVRDWDKLNDLHLLASAFKSITVRDASVQITGSNYHIINAIQHLMDQTMPTHQNKVVLTYPQLIVEGTTISSYHLQTLQTHSREKEEIEYLTQQNSWSGVEISWQITSTTTCKTTQIRNPVSTQLATNKHITLTSTKIKRTTMSTMCSSQRDCTTFSNLQRTHYQSIMA
jgi:hypothetical protein